MQVRVYAGGNPITIQMSKSDPFIAIYDEIIAIKNWRKDNKAFSLYRQSTRLFYRRRTIGFAMGDMGLANRRMLVLNLMNFSFGG